MNGKRQLVAALVIWGLAGCSASSRKTEEQDGEFNPVEPTMACSTYVLETNGSTAAFQVKAEFGVPPYTISGLTYDTDPTGEDELGFTDEQYAFNSTNRVDVTGIPSGADSVFGEVELSDAAGKTASCSFTISLQDEGGGDSSEIAENCLILFSHNPTLPWKVVYLTVIPTDRYGWYWLRDVRATSGNGLVYGGSPDGVTGQMLFTQGGIFTVEADVEDPATGATGKCTGTQWVYYF